MLVYGKNNCVIVVKHEIDQREKNLYNISVCNNRFFETLLQDF